MRPIKKRPEEISIALLTIVQRKQPDLPRFVVIPAQLVADWKITGTTIIEGTLNGIDMGRRWLKPWDENRWFIELPEPLCKKARVEKGHSVTIVMSLALDEMPVELTQLMASDPGAKSAWEKLTASQQRMLRQHILAAKQPATRQRRAKQALC